MRLSYAKPTDAPALYIQCKGNHSGRPLRHYIPNSFAIYTDDTNAFAKIFVLYKARIYEPYIIGSVVPFIRIHDVRHIHRTYMPILDAQCPKLLATIQMIEEAIYIKTDEISKLKDLQQAFAMKASSGP